MRDEIKYRNVRSLGNIYGTQASKKGRKEKNRSTDLGVGILFACQIQLINHLS